MIFHYYFKFKNKVLLIIKISILIVFNLLENGFFFYLELTIEVIEGLYFFNLSDKRNPLLIVVKLLRK